MIKKLVLAICMFPTLLTAQSLLGDNDWNEMDLQGKVKCLTEVQYKMTSVKGKPQKQYLGRKIHYIFNEQGFLLQEIEFESADESVQTKKVYRYDHTGRVNVIEQYQQDTTRITTLSTFTYDSAGRVTQCKIENLTYILSPRTTVYTYSYALQGTCSEMKGWNNDGELFTSYRYTYDEAGHKTLEIWQDANGDTLHMISFFYNKAGQKYIMPLLFWFMVLI